MSNPPSQSSALECAICFSDTRLTELAQCDEGHLFCSECFGQLAAHAIGADDYTAMHCGDQSGCKAAFCRQERLKFLEAGDVQTLDKLEALAMVLKAGAPDLHGCPSCGEMRIVDEADVDFHCPNDACGQVSCLACQRKPHPGSSCSEAASKNVAALQHRVAEEMTDALVRACPGCQARFLKESGCNLITCRKCNAKSCYLCRQIVPGYPHFSNAGCPLFDKTNDRHVTEVNAAQERAIQREAAAARELKLTRGHFDFGDAIQPVPILPAAPPIPPVPLAPVTPPLPVWQPLPREPTAEEFAQRDQQERRDNIRRRRNDNQVAADLVRLVEKKGKQRVPGTERLQQAPPVGRALNQQADNVLSRNAVTGRVCTPFAHDAKAKQVVQTEPYVARAPVAVPRASPLVIPVARPFESPDARRPHVAKGKPPSDLPVPASKPRLPSPPSCAKSTRASKAKYPSHQRPGHVQKSSKDAVQRLPSVGPSTATRKKIKETDSGKKKTKEADPGLGSSLAAPIYVASSPTPDHQPVQHAGPSSKPKAKHRKRNAACRDIVPPFLKGTTDINDCLALAHDPVAALARAQRSLKRAHPDAHDQRQSKDQKDRKDRLQYAK